MSQSTKPYTSLPGKADISAGFRLHTPAHDTSAGHTPAHGTVVCVLDLFLQVTDQLDPFGAITRLVQAFLRE